MRTPVPGALVASTASSAANYDAASQRHLLRPARHRRSLSRALGEVDLSVALLSQPANSWDFVTMGSRAKTDNEPEQALVDDIARAMQNPPLMRRLASIGAEFGEAPLAAPAPAALMPPQLGPVLGTPSLSAPIDSFTAIAAGIGIAPLASGVSDLDLIKRRVEEAEAGWTLPPRSAEWLGKARREHRRTLLRNAAAWLATLFIGGTIIVATALMLQH